jgi:hypothetical protein
VGDSVPTSSSPLPNLPTVGEIPTGSSGPAVGTVTDGTIRESSPVFVAPVPSPLASPGAPALADASPSGANAPATVTQTFSSPNAPSATGTSEREPAVR